MRPSDLFSIPTTTVKKSNFFGDNFGITTDSIIQGNLRSVPPLSAYDFQANDFGFFPLISISCTNCAVENRFGVIH